MHLRRRRQDRGFDAGARERFRKIRRPMRNPVLLRDRLDGLLPAARETRDLDARDILETVQMPLTERALPDHDDLHQSLPSRGAPKRRSTNLTAN
jgi:hypothetical protein